MDDCRSVKGGVRLNPSFFLLRRRRLVECLHYILFYGITGGRFFGTRGVVDLKQVYR